MLLGVLELGGVQRDMTGAVVVTCKVGGPAKSPQVALARRESQACAASPSVDASTDGVDPVVKLPNLESCGVGGFLLCRTPWPSSLFCRPVRYYHLCRCAGTVRNLV